MNNRLWLSIFVTIIGFGFTGGLVSGPMRLACGQEANAPAKASEEEAGRAELEEATDLKLSGDPTLESLGKVINLAERAVEKGLGKESQTFAKDLIASSAMQRAEILAKQARGARLDAAQLRRLRTAILADLEKAIKYEPKMLDAYLMIAQLRETGQEHDEAIKTLNQGIDSGSDDRPAMSKLLMFRALLQPGMADKLNDLQRSVEIDPTNEAAWLGRIEILKKAERYAEGFEVSQQWLEKDPANLEAIAAAYELLARLDRLDDAVKLLNEKIKQQPDKGELYRFRGQIYSMQDKDDLAIADFTKASELNPEDAQSLLNRAQVRIQLHDQLSDKEPEKAKKELEQARNEIDMALKKQPGLVFGLLLRSEVSTRQQNYAEAIQDMMLLVRDQPNNVELLASLARLYMADEQNAQAVLAADRILKLNRESWQGFQIRADANLGLGEHTKALEDYERALELGPEKRAREGLLNNFAWVLATSTENGLRDGKRAIKLATEACELSDYSKPHILSTLAAGYAEVGDFETAMKWSAKAVELAREGKDDQLDQLEKELDSYKQKKPWREKQEAKEKAVPAVPAGKGVDT